MLEREGGLDELVRCERDADSDYRCGAAGTEVRDEGLDDRVGVARGSAGTVANKATAREIRKTTEKRRTGSEVGAEAVNGFVGVLAVFDFEGVGPNRCCEASA